MKSDREQALAYFQAPANRLWLWADEGKVIVWQDGSTIGFREEIRLILDWLGPNGLPPFGAVVLMLAACRGKVPTVPGFLNEPSVVPELGTGVQARALRAARGQFHLQLEAALGELHKLTKFPPDLIRGVKAKCVLAEMLFEPSRVERALDGPAILRGSSELFLDFELNRASETKIHHVRHVHILANGLKLHSPDTLLVRLLTGLDALPVEADVNLPFFERARHLLEELSRDPEHSAVSLAARELMAALRLPRRLSVQDETTHGGLADISNRGPLDRLLLSELAHDDLTLAVRVALNESLYLRREPPRHDPPCTLAILLDSGVRLWGVPRVLAAATALALAAREKKFEKVLAWRASGKTAQPLDLFKRDGLIAHLASLEPQADCAAALPAFVEALRGHGEIQSVIITHPDAVDDPAFRRAVSVHASDIDFVATVERNGRFEMRAVPLGQRHPFCAAELDLASIFQQRSQPVPLLDQKINPSLPIIFGVKPFPFLLPVAGRAERWATSPEGDIYHTLNDRRLIEFKNERTGCRVLDPLLPPGKTFWMRADSDDIHLVKAPSNNRPARLVTVSRLEPGTRVVDLRVLGELLAVHAQDQILLAIRRHDVSAYSLASGSLLGQVPNPHYWMHGRFFRTDAGVSFVSWDGQSINFQPVTLPRHIEAWLVFDREGEEGPWVISRKGEILSTVTGKVAASLPQGPAILGGLQLSADGNRISYHQKHPSRPIIIDLKTGRPAIGVLDPSPGFPTWNVLRVIDAVAAMPGEGLALRGRRERWRKLVLNQHGKLEIQECPNIHSGVMSFSHCPVPARFGCSLQVAKWPSGGKTWLDSRGLLHLKSHDPEIPEVSLVLGHGEVAGWTSDGFMCGPGFFLGDDRTSEPFKVFDRFKHLISVL